MVSAALLALIYVAFISLGLPDAVLGSAWPVMSTDVSAPLWGAGLIQMTVSFGTVISSLNCARLLRRFGTGKLTALSVLMTALALLGFSVAGHYAFLVLLAVPLGLGAGAVDAALNNYVALHCEPRHMSWLHCSWGVGTIIGPVILAFFLRRGLSWSGGYVTIGVLQCLLSAVLFKALPMWKQSGAEEEEKRAKVLSLREVIAIPGAKDAMMTFLLYCGIESIVILWASTFMVEARGVDEIQAASWGALYCIGITVGRGLSGFMTYRFSPKQMVYISAAVMVLGSLLLFVPVVPVMVAGLIVFGLGCAPVYPNMIQDTPLNFGAENSQAVIGAQMASAYVGTTCLPTIFGALADALGYGILPVFALMFSGLMTAAFIRLKKRVEIN